MSRLKDRARRRKEERLLEDGVDDEGISNPSMDEEVQEITQPSGTDSSPELEAAEADALVKTLKTKRTKKKRELADEVISPKDDLAREMKEAKRKSKAKVDELERLEMEETARTEVADDGTLPMPVADDGTLPMPEGEEEAAGEPASPKEEEEEESLVKKLRKKREQVEETPIEGPPEEAVAPTKEEEPKEKPPSRPTSPGSEADTERKTPRMASMRAKMMERLAKAKEEAMSEVKEEAKESRRERRLQRDKTQRTRFDPDQPSSRFDEVEAEELERMTEEKRKLREERKKKLAAARKEGVYMPTVEEAYDFFTRIDWEEEPVEKAETEKKEKKEGEEPEEKEGEEPKEGEEEGEAEPKPGKPEDEQPLIAAEIDNLGFPTVVARADFPDPDEVKQKEDKIYFVPSRATIPAAQKVGEQMEVRCLEEEGFYVGTRPETSGWNQNKMEHRLLKEAESGHPNSKKWFGEDGKLLALPDPLRAQPSRPPVTEEVEPYLQTVYKKAIIREFDNRYIDGTTEGGGHYQLDVDINQICFSHHHLYSREHVLAQRLTQLYDQYVIRQKKNMTEYLGQKLKALKNSALHLQDHIAAHRSEHSITDRSNYERRLQDYKAEIRQARQQRDREEKTDRTLLKNIVHTWKEIRTQRDLQRFTNTPVKLQIRKEEVDKTQDQFIWKQEIEDEIEELRDENEREFKRKHLTYEEELAKYQKQQQNKIEAEKRLRKKRGRRKESKQSKASGLSDTALEDYDEEAQQKDQEILDEADLMQPEPPEQFDEAAVREQVKAKAMESRRRPGEPKLDLELSNTATITPTAQCPSGEQKRRDEVSKCKIFVKILFNNKEVSRTSAKPLTQDFKVSYGQIYNMKIMQWPESIAFQVYESEGLSTNLMAELCAPIPDTSVTSQSVQLEDLEFSSDLRVNHSHEGVGSGLPFTFGKDGQELLILMTTGSLTFSVAWAVDENGQALVPPTSTSNITSMFSNIKKMDPLAAIGAAGVMDMKILAEWFYDSRLDPNDPSNADIVYILRGKAGDVQTPAEYFRLEQLMAEFDFVDDDEFNNNKRFQLLQLRDEEVAEFRNYKRVPAFEREIPRDTFTEYERKKREEQKLRQLDDIESHRAAVKRFRQRIREQVMRQFRVQSHRKRWEDVVFEEAVPNIAILGTSLLNLFARRAPLKPKRKERKNVSAQNVVGPVKILVNISRAYNIPVRIAASSAGTTGTLTAREPERRKPETTVRPFVEVMFQHNSFRTSVGEGSNPSFNEELEIPFKAPNDDFSTANLQTVTDCLFLNLFDEVVIDIQEDDRQRGSSVHQRIEKKWLGSLKIPFTTVYFNGKIDGTFRVSAPPILLGYMHETSRIGELDVGIDKDIKTLLNLFVTIEPPLTQPEPVKERFTTNEDEKLMVYADQWQAQISAKFNHKREVKTFVTDVNFKSVFITRYFKAIKPPEELTNRGLSADATAELVARYVSLIPFIPDSMIFPGLCDIWNTCDQFLQMLSGDEEEHAILLVNYFLALGKKAWLICGSAIPEGPTAYVLTEETSGFWIWNPSSGDHFRTQDTTAPLQSIGCLVNAENIWANIQQYDKPSQMTFNLSDSATWQTIFSSKYPSPGLGSIQPDALYYFPTDKDYVVELQEKIQSMLKNKIMDWRSRYITRWNRHCTQIMRKMLPLLEESCGKTVADQHLHELEQSFSTYKVSGFPINMPFTEIDPIIEMVYATGVHAQESSDVEFALAVYVHPYPNSVLSVWVYVASLMRMR